MIGFLSKVFVTATIQFAILVPCNCFGLVADVGLELCCKSCMFQKLHHVIRNARTCNCNVSQSRYEIQQMDFHIMTYDEYSKSTSLLCNPTWVRWTRFALSCICLCCHPALIDFRYNACHPGGVVEIMSHFQVATYNTWLVLFFSGISNAMRTQGRTNIYNAF